MSVVGCGQRGVFYAAAFALAGFQVFCVDADQSAVKQLSKGYIFVGEHKTEMKLKSLVKAGKLVATNDLKTAVAKSEFIIITNSPKFDGKRNSDPSDVENICKQVGEALPRGSLVVYGGIAGFGFTEAVVKEGLENASGFKAGEGFGLAFNPMHSVGLLGGEELRVVGIADVQAAELAALFAAVKNDVQAALANELAVFCEGAGVDFSEISQLAGATGLVPTIADEENREEVYFLLENAENLNEKLRFSALARQVND